MWKSLSWWLGLFCDYLSHWPWAARGHTVLGPRTVSSVPDSKCWMRPWLIWWGWRRTSHTRTCPGPTPPNKGTKEEKTRTAQCLGGWPCCVTGHCLISAPLKGRTLKNHTHGSLCMRTSRQPLRWYSSLPPFSYFLLGTYEKINI